VSRVVYVGNFGPPHSTENEVLRALSRLGHDVEARQEQEQATWSQRVDADVFLWTRTRSLSEQVDVELRDGMLNDCRERGIPTVGYHLDRWWGLGREPEVGVDPFFRVSLLCTADGGHDQQWADRGVRHVWFPPAISEFECGLGRDRVEFHSYVAFVGSWDGYGHPEWWPQRSRMLAHVESWYGDAFARWPLRGRSAIRGVDLKDLYASTDVVVGDSCLAPAADGTPMTRYWSDRVPETLGRGGILVHPDVEGMDCDMPLFTYDLGDMDMLHDRIETLLSWSPENTMKMRRQAVAWTQMFDTYTARMRRLWEVLGL